MRRKVLKRLFTLILSLVLIINTSFVASVEASEDRMVIKFGESIYKYKKDHIVSVVIDGISVKTGDMPAVIIDKRTLVPVREVFESDAFGATVDWNGEKKEVYIAHKDNLIVLKINSKKFYVNGKEKEFDVPPMLISDITDKKNPKPAKTMIPIRFVSEYLGYEVDWEQETFTASLKSDEYKKREAAGVVEEEKEHKDVEKDTLTIKGNDKKKEEVEDKEKATGKKLDSISGKGANRALPTPLFDNPVEFNTKYEIPKQDLKTIPIKEEKYEDTNITELHFDAETNTFEVVASSEISDAKISKWDGKFIIDIPSSTNMLPPATSFSDNSVVNRVRSSQFKEDPKVTRVVFDLVDENYELFTALSEDRKKIIVRSSKNYISNLKLAQDEKSDYIDIQGTFAPELKIFRLSAPDRIVIDMPDTISLLDFREGEADGQYVKKIRTSQFTDSITRVVVETDGQPDYKILKQEDGVTRLAFLEPNYENIGYENKDKPTVKITEAGKDINVKDISYENDYRNKKFIITLSGNYKDKFGKGSLKVNDGIIEEVSVDSDGENTIVTILSSEIYEYRIKKDEGILRIKAYKPKDLYDKIVVVDAGHGGKDPGANGNGLIEKDVNLDIVKALKNYLDADESIHVYYTRLVDEYPSLQDRCDIANEVQADLFLSVHNNAYHSKHHGTETLYYPTEDNEGFTSKNTAKIFQKNMINYLGSYDRGLKKRPNLYVLHHTFMPAVLVEVGFVTNEEEAKKLASKAYIDKAGKSLYKSILDVFEKYPTGR